MSDDTAEFDAENILGKYVLNDEGDPVPEPDLFKWAAWFESNDRTVLYDRIGRAHISTIFLAIDHGFHRLVDRTAPPILWETMVFGHPLFDRWRWRYSTKLDALHGHMRIRDMIERFGHPPRRTKKALQKTPPFRPGDQQRVRRWYNRVYAFEARAARERLT